MKFAEHLAAHITPEWRKQYISYEVGQNVIIIYSRKQYIMIHNSILFSNNDFEIGCIFLIYCVLQEMKEMLYAAIEQVPAPDQVDPDSLSRYYAKFDEKFFSFCDKELAKINTFYSGFEQHL